MTEPTTGSTQGRPYAEVIHKAHAGLVMIGAYLKSTPEEQAQVKLDRVVAMFNDATLQCRLWLRENGHSDLVDVRDWLGELVEESLERERYRSALLYIAANAAVGPPEPPQEGVPLDAWYNVLVDCGRAARKALGK